MHQNEKALNKYLAPIDVWAISIGCVIGWGAFVMPGTTFLPAAGPVGTVIAMAVSTLVTLVLGINYHSLMCRYPGTGGVYAYSKAVFGKDHAFLSSWFLCLAYVSLIPQNATVLALILRILSGNVWKGTISYQIAGTRVYLIEIAISAAVLLLVGFLAIYLKAFLQGVQTALGLILLIGVILIAVLVTPHISAQSLFSSFGSLGHSPIRGILSIIILAPWAFVGFEVVSLETAHFRFPIKKSGKLIIIAIIMGGLIYSVLGISAILSQPDAYSGWQDYISNLGELSGIDSVPTFYVLRDVLGSFGLVVISVTAFAAVLSSIVGFYRASARLLMNMAEDHILSGTFKKPSVCFLFLMGLSVVISLFGRTALSWIVDLSSFGAIVGFGYVSAAILKLSRNEKRKKGVLPGLAGLILAVLFAVAQLIPGISLIETMKAESYLLLAIWCMIGFLFYWRTMKTEEQDENRNEAVTIAALSFLLFLSILIWYIKNLFAEFASGFRMGAMVGYSIVLIVFILLGLIVMLQIHTQLKKKQMRLETERIRAVESSQAKSRFLFNMSHDIRTPMNAVIGYANLALKEESSPTVRDYLEKIDLSGRHMLSLINDILEMSRIETGKMELEEKPADLKRLLASLEHLFCEQMKEKKISFEIDDSRIRHSFVYCDEKNLTRILLNLISNAYKFTPEGGEIRVRASGSEFDDDGRALYEFSVKDNGIGMSEDFAERMFTAFERERSSTDSGVEGTGLGLAITKSLLDLMQGEILVDTAKGRGTEMTIRLKLKEAKEVLPEEQNKDLQAETSGQMDYSKKRLLLVEDNEINMEIACMILSQQGFMLETAENGQIALDKIRAADAGYYDAVLMDIQMPVMDGYTATREIRKLENPEKAKIPVIAMTANAFKEDQENAFRSGMQAHIAKPLDVETMMNTLNQILKESEAEIL